MSLIETPTPRTLNIGRMALDSMVLAKVKLLFDEANDFPTKLMVPKGHMVTGARALMKVYGDLALGIPIEWHAVSESWALIGTKVIVQALHPTLPGAIGRQVK